MTLARLVITLLPTLAACPSTNGSECDPTEQMCDDSCVPSNAVCCNNGYGAICPIGYTCGTNASTPCIKNTGAATLVTINGTDQACPDFVPNPVSVKTGAGLIFKNQTTVVRTIVGRQAPPPWSLSTGTPWVSTQPGETSNAVNFSVAGTYSYATTTHLGSCDTRWGQLYVTVN